MAFSEKKGFTLIELLIVLTILAILVATATISLTQFIGTGETEACHHDARALQSAVLAFRTQDSGWPTADGQGGDIVWDTDDDNGDEFMAKYVLAIPDSDADCDWHVNDEGVVAPADDAVNCSCD